MSAIELKAIQETERLQEELKKKYEALLQQVKGIK